MYDINNSLFKYPIEYLKNKKKTSKNLCEDLELLSTKDKENKPVLNTFFSNTILEIKNIAETNIAIFSKNSF